MTNTNDFYMPPEWLEHERTFISWPVKTSLIYPDNYELVCDNYASIIRGISAYETVTVIANEDSLSLAKSLCGDHIEYLVIPHNDAWCRDNGPTFLVNNQGERSAVNWNFNAWGEKYLPYDLDNQVAPSILDHFHISRFDSTIVLEGGSIHVDGEGTLLTTKECLLNPNRNPSLTQEEIEKELKERLNISSIIWLEQGLFGDETDGHVDNVACFAKPGTILLQTCSDPNDPNYEISQQHLNVLSQSIDAAGRSIEIIEIPQPPARYYEGERLTLSYLNFYFVNNGIILPVFGEDAAQADQVAIDILSKVFPTRKITPINTSALITEGGNIHCITQQMPNSLLPQ